MKGLLLTLFFTSLTSTAFALDTYPIRDGSYYCFKNPIKDGDVGGSTLNNISNMFHEMKISNPNWYCVSIADEDNGKTLSVLKQYMDREFTSVFFKLVDSTSKAYAAHTNEIWPEGTSILNNLGELIEVITIGPNADGKSEIKRQDFCVEVESIPSLKDRTNNWMMENLDEDTILDSLGLD